MKTKKKYSKKKGGSTKTTTLQTTTEEYSPTKSFLHKTGIRGNTQLDVKNSSIKKDGKYFFKKLYNLSTEILKDHDESDQKVIEMDNTTKIICEYGDFISDNDLNFQIRFLSMGLKDVLNRMIWLKENLSEIRNAKIDIKGERSGEETKKDYENQYNNLQKDKLKEICRKYLKEYFNSVYSAEYILSTLMLLLSFKLAIVFKKVKDEQQRKLIEPVNDLRGDIYTLNSILMHLSGEKLNSGVKLDSKFQLNSGLKKMLFGNFNKKKGILEYLNILQKKYIKFLGEYYEKDDKQNKLYCFEDEESGLSPSTCFKLNDENKSGFDKEFTKETDPYNSEDYFEKIQIDRNNLEEEKKHRNRSLSQKNIKVLFNLIDKVREELLNRGGKKKTHVKNRRNNKDCKTRKLKHRQRGGDLMNIINFVKQGRLDKVWEYLIMPKKYTINEYKLNILKKRCKKKITWMSQSLQGNPGDPRKTQHAEGELLLYLTDDECKVILFGIMQQMLKYFNFGIKLKYDEDKNELSVDDEEALRDSLSIITESYFNLALQRKLVRKAVIGDISFDSDEINPGDPISLYEHPRIRNSYFLININDRLFPDNMFPGKTAEYSLIFAKTLVQPKGVITKKQMYDAINKVFENNNLDEGTAIYYHESLEDRMESIKNYNEDFQVHNEILRILNELNDKYELYSQNNINEDEIIDTPGVHTVLGVAEGAPEAPLYDSGVGGGNGFESIIERGVCSQPNSFHCCIGPLKLEIGDQEIIGKIHLIRSSGMRSSKNREKIKGILSDEEFEKIKEESFEKAKNLFYREIKNHSSQVLDIYTNKAMIWSKEGGKYDELLKSLSKDRYLKDGKGKNVTNLREINENYKKYVINGILSGGLCTVFFKFPELVSSFMGIEFQVMVVSGILSYFLIGFFNNRMNKITNRYLSPIFNILLIIVILGMLLFFLKTVLVFIITAGILGDRLESVSLGSLFNNNIYPLFVGEYGEGKPYKDIQDRIEDGFLTTFCGAASKQDRIDLQEALEEERKNESWKGKVARLMKETKDGVTGSWDICGYIATILSRIIGFFYDCIKNTVNFLNVGIDNTWEHKVNLDYFKEQNREGYIPGTASLIWLLYCIRNLYVQRNYHAELMDNFYEELEKESNNYRFTNENLRNQFFDTQKQITEGSGGLGGSGGMIAKICNSIVAEGQIIKDQTKTAMDYKRSEIEGRVAQANIASAEAAQLANRLREQNMVQHRQRQETLRSMSSQGQRSQETHRLGSLQFDQSSVSGLHTGDNHGPRRRRLEVGGFKRKNKKNSRRKGTKKKRKLKHYKISKKRRYYKF